MNSKIRKRLEAIETALSEFKDELETIKDEEQEKYDNMPESFQDADKGQAMMNAIDELDYAVSSLDDCIGNIGNAYNQ
jgi:uncharacterized coiled-coil DUF342 family protein